MCRHLYFLFTLILPICCGFGKDLPSVACPENFEYLQVKDGYVGQVSVILNGSATANNVTVELSVPDVIAVRDIGEIKLFDSVFSVVEKLRNNEKINFHIDLASTEKMPKLTRIVVNDEIICQGLPYAPPFTLAVRTLVFHRVNKLARDSAED